MADILGSVPVGQFSLGAIVTIIILFILRGELVTRRQLTDTQANCDKWRQAAEKWQDTASQLGMTVEKILNNVEMTNHAIVDIRELALRIEAERRT